MADKRLILLLALILASLAQTAATADSAGPTDRFYELPRVLIVYDDYELAVTRAGLPSRTAIMINYVVPTAFSTLSQLPDNISDYNVIVFDTSIGEYQGVSLEYINFIEKTIRSGKPVIILGRGFTREQVSLLSNATGMFFEVVGKYNMEYYVKPELTVYPGAVEAEVKTDKMDRDVWYAVNTALSSPSVRPIIGIGGGYLLAAENNKTAVVFLSVDDTIILRDPEFWASLIYGLLGAPEPWPRIPAYYDFGSGRVCTSALILAFHDYPVSTELDVVEHYMFPASMFIISGYYGTWSKLLPRIEKLVRLNLIDIIPHSLKHASLHSVHDALLGLVLSRKIFLSLFHKDFVMMAPPGGNETEIRLYEAASPEENKYIATHPVRGYAFVYYVNGTEHIGSPAGPIPSLVSGETPLYTDIRRLLEIVDENLAYHRTIVIDVHPGDAVQIQWSDIMERFVPIVLSRDVCVTTMSRIIQYGWDRHFIHVYARRLGDNEYELVLQSPEPVIVPIEFNGYVEEAVDERGRELAWITGKTVVVYVDGERTIRVRLGAPRLGPIVGVSADQPHRPLVDAYLSGGRLVIDVHRDPRIIGDTYTVRIRVGTAEAQIPVGRRMEYPEPKMTYYNITLLTYDGAPISHARIYVLGYPSVIETDDYGSFKAYVPFFIDVYGVFGGRKYVLTGKNGTIKLNVVKILFPKTYASIVGTRYACRDECYLPRTTLQVYVIGPDKRGLYTLDLSNARSGTVYTNYIVSSGITGDPGSYLVVLALVAAVFLGSYGFRPR